MGVHASDDNGVRSQEQPWWISEEFLILGYGALALKFDGRSAKGFRDILVHGQFLEIHGIDDGKKMQGNVERQLWIVDEITDNDVILAERAIGGDEAKNLVRKIGHSSKSFHFLFGEARRLEDCALDDLVAVTNKSATGLGAAFDRELNSLRHGHFCNLLQEGLATLNIGLGFCGGFGQCCFIHRGAVHFVQENFLIRGYGAGMFEGRSKGEGITDTAEVFEESLNSNRGQMLNDGNKESGGATLVLNQCFADAGLVGEVFGSISKNRREGFRSFDGFNERFWRHGEKRFPGVLGDHLVRIVGEDSQNFGAIGGSEVSAAGANG